MRGLRKYLNDLVQLLNGLLARTSAHRLAAVCHSCPFMGSSFGGRPCPSRGIDSFSWVVCSCGICLWRGSGGRQPGRMSRLLMHVGGYCKETGAARIGFEPSGRRGIGE